MKSLFRKIVGILFLGLIGGVLIIAGMPLYRVYYVLIPALNESRDLIKAGHDESAIQNIERLDLWLRDYPPLYCESARLLTRSWTHLKHPDRAHAVVASTLTFLESKKSSSHAKTIKEWMQTPANAFVMQDIETRYGRPASDSIRQVLAGEMGAPISAPTTDAATETEPNTPDTSESNSQEPPETVDNEEQVASEAFVPDTFPAWAVIKTPVASVRGKTGKALSKIKAGTIVEVTGKAIIQGKLYPCIQTDAAGASVGVYVAGSDLDLHPGDLDQVKPAIRQLAVKRARILAALYKIEHLAETTNPYEKLLSQVQTDKAALKNKIPALVAKRDKSSGAQRVDASDELHTLRDQLAALERKEKTLKDSMAEWKAAQKPATAQDSQKLKKALHAITAELEKAESGS